MKASEAMRKEIVVLDGGASVAEASKAMREKLQGCAIVVRECKPIGIVTERDVTWKVAGEGRDPKAVKVSEIMSSPLITIDPDADIVEAAKLMKEHEIRRLAVARHEILYGILTAADLARHLEGYVDAEVRRILRYAFFPISHG